MGQELAGLRSWASWQDRTLGSTTWGATTSPQHPGELHSTLFCCLIIFLGIVSALLPKLLVPKGALKKCFQRAEPSLPSLISPALPVLWTKDKLFPQPLPELSSHLFFHLQTMIIKVTTPNQKMKKHAVTKTWHCRFPGSHQLTTLVTKVVLTFARFCREHQAKA